MNIYSITILVYFVIVIVLGLLSRKVASKSASDYLIAGRNLGTIVCAIVVAAEWLGGMSTICERDRLHTNGCILQGTCCFRDQQSHSRGKA